jgi:prefoldin subunit 5
MEEWWNLTPSYQIDGERCSPRQAVEKFFEKARRHESQLSSISSYYQTLQQTLQQIAPHLNKCDERISRLEKLRSLSGEDIVNLIRKEIEPLTIENKKLKEEIEQLKRQLVTQQQQAKTSGHLSPSKANYQQGNDFFSFDQTIEAFNAWAKNPGVSLPSSFCYAEGDLKLREKQEIQPSSANNATWVMNISGSTKYLFPNPNAIDQISGRIDTLYSITGNRRARGQNRVTIQKACCVQEDGWIEYKGALSLV